MKIIVTLALLAIAAVSNADEIEPAVATSSAAVAPPAAVPAAAAAPAARAAAKGAAGTAAGSATAALEVATAGSISSALLTAAIASSAKVTMLFISRLHRPRRRWCRELWAPPEPDSP